MLVWISLFKFSKKKLKSTILIFLVSLFLSINSIALENKILIKVNNEIITTQDLKNEKKYLKLLNPSFQKLDEESILKAAKNSIIREKIKQIEIEKNLIPFRVKNEVLESYIKNIYSKINLQSKNEFEKFLKSNNLNIDFIRDKISVELLWNNLIYMKYSSRVKINEKNLKNKLTKNQNKYIKRYNLNEIIFSYVNKDELNSKYIEIKKDIDQKGFSSAALIHSISDTNKIGGELGWIDQKSINKKIYKQLELLKDGEYSKPIIIPGGALILKLNKTEKKELKVNLENELRKMIEIEKNNQLNQFSNLYYNKIKKSIIINEI